MAKKTNFCSGNVIILNKPFLGGWLHGQGNIGHEIIDFLKTDNGEYYVYNLPWGVCPDNIWVEGTRSFEKNKTEKYVAKYLVLTSEVHENAFEILYVIELEEKLHRFHTQKDSDAPKSNCQEIKNIIDKNQIKYNGKFLYEIFGNDSLCVTFKGKKIYKATTQIRFELSSYKYQRNKGYLYDDKNKDDYEEMLNIIKSSIAAKRLQRFHPKSVCQAEIKALRTNKTFIDLIQQESNEQIFTNILFSILSQGDLLKHFCLRHHGKKAFDSKGVYTVSREFKVVDGRTDVCAESSAQRIIIENKIYSGLNGVRADNTTQLSAYYHWGEEKGTEPLCFLVAPDYRCNEISEEIGRKDSPMRDKYIIIKYSEIASFIEEEYNNGYIPEDYVYYSLVPQIIDSFRNPLYASREDFYAKLFLDATN